MSDEEKRVIKKYPNRRLYDTSESKYVTLNDVRKLVLDGVSFCVIDKKSGDDITRNILLQIIIEQEDEGEPLFTTDVLEQLIGFYGNSVQGVAGDFIGQSLNMFREHFGERVVGWQPFPLYLNAIQPVDCFCHVFRFCIYRVSFGNSQLENHRFNFFTKKTDEVSLLWLH